MKLANAKLLRPNVTAWLVLLCLVIVAGVIRYNIASPEMHDLFNDALNRIAVMIVYILPFPLILLFNAKWPVHENKNIVTSGLKLDVFYYFSGFIISASIVALVAIWFKGIYDQYLSFMTIEISEEIPVWVRFILAFLFLDFLGWLHHLVRHKVPLFWFFHSIHHSQRDMNYFTDGRVHVVDRIFASLIIFIPLYMIQIPAPQVILFAIIRRWNRMAYHSNLKTNYGVLKYVLVTPQSHRIHHSSLPEHADKNFGVDLSIWDHFFGTQYRGYDEYPVTGIQDNRFPVEIDGEDASVLGSFGAQFLYPFKQLSSRASELIRALRNRCMKIGRSRIKRQAQD